METPTIASEKPSNSQDLSMDSFRFSALREELQAKNLSKCVKCDLMRHSQILSVYSFIKRTMLVKSLLSVISGMKRLQIHPVSLLIRKPTQEKKHLRVMNVMKNPQMQLYTQIIRKCVQVKNHTSVTAVM